MSTIWLHGAAMNASTWGDVPGRAVDLPGHGTAPRVARNVAAYADAVMPDDSPVALVGHSLGGMVALELARRLGERCRALVLVDAPLWIPGGPLRLMGGPWARLTARVPGPRGVGAVITRWTAKGPGREVVRQAFATLSPKGLRDAFLTALSFDARPFLHHLKCPILALWARWTCLTNGGMRRALHTAQPTARSEMINTGHMMHFDNRPLVMGHILPFLEAHA